MRAPTKRITPVLRRNVPCLLQSEASLRQNCPELRLAALCFVVLHAAPNSGAAERRKHHDMEWFFATTLRKGWSTTVWEHSVDTTRDRQAGGEAIRRFFDGGERAVFQQNLLTLFQVRQAILSDVSGLYSLRQFPFRLQPIFQVITKQSAVGAVDLVGAIQQFLDPPRFSNCVSVKESVLQFKLSTNLFF